MLGKPSYHDVASRRVDLFKTFITRTDTLVMPPNTRSLQPTQPTRTQKRKHGRRGAQDSEDEVDDALPNTQGIGEDDDLDRTRGVNNDVGRSHTVALLRITPKPPRKQIKRLGTWSVLRYSQKTAECH